MHIGVEDPGFEVHLGRNYGVFLRQHNLHFKNTLRIGAVLRSVDVCQPVQNILLVEDQEEIGILMLPNL